MTLKHIFKRMKEGLLQEIFEEIKWIYGYARQYWKHMVLYTLLGLTGTAFSLIGSLISKDLVDIITGHQTGPLVQTFCLMIGFTIGNTILTQISNYASTMINLKVNTEIKSDVFDKILVTDLESVASYHTGDLLTRWSSDTTTISNGILNLIPNFIIYLTRFISALCMVLYYDPTFAIFALLGFPFSLIMSKSLMKRMKNNNRRSAAMNAKLSGFNQETFANIQTIKAFDLLRLYSRRLRSLQKEYIDMQKDFQKLSMATAIIMSFIGLLVTYSCYGWGIYRVWSGVISYGTMTMFLTLSGTLTGSLNSLTSLVPTFISITTSARRLMDILNMPREDFSQIPEVDAFYEKHQTEGVSLSLKQVSYHYQNGTQVFTGVNIEAHPQEIIALVGPSGEGKTTMLRILLALIHPQEGACTIYNGSSEQEILPFSPAVRRLFSYVPQGNTMFSGTIAENMRNVKEDATDEEIISVLKMACAWDFVKKLPDGIYSKVGERGNGFSEGQSQRLSIARALLRNAPVLLLDEATSALDVATERKVLQNIMTHTSPRTCIVTTHRPTVINFCDRVYSIHDQHCELLSSESIQEMLQEQC
ncbi:MAG: ABC transporter ATP-binding protein [Butyribacter sp.]|nr:ABC transporter ATP-binding protein [bacterium]MDY3854322.1 ABC transporter ATP-binding protein [Butyribacter sp.]